MSYKFREVKCPWCGHIFMWNENGWEERIVIYHYRLKETGERLGKTKCPKCDIDMIVQSSVLEGIDPKDDRVEAIGVRGI